MTARTPIVVGDDGLLQQLQSGDALLVQYGILRRLFGGVLTCDSDGASTCDGSLHVDSAMTVDLN